MSAASSSSSSSTISAACSGIERRERLPRVGVLGHLGQRLARELRRKRLHDGDALVLVERREHVGEIGRLEVVRPADERGDLARADELHHAFDLVVRMSSWSAGLEGHRAASSRAGSRSRSMRVGDAWSTSNSSPRTREPLAGVGDPAGPFDQQTGDRRGAAPPGATTPKRSSMRLAAGGCRRSRPVRDRRGRWPADFLVVLVEDLADQLLEQILQRRDAERAAELVEHDGQVAALPLHIEQQVAAAPAGRASRPPVAPAAGRPVRGLNRSKACSIPTMSSRVPRNTGMRL